MTEAVKRRPYTVVLFDEFEKADRQVSNLLLQLFDEGRLTDSFGKTVDFTNTVIILTSNLGSEVLDSLVEGEDAETVRDEVMQVVRMNFPPEFINRLDEIILFNRLDKSHLLNVLELQLEQVKKMLEHKKLALTVDDNVKVFLLEQGYEPVYGARPIKRAVQAHLLSPLASYLLSTNVRPGSMIYTTLNDKVNQLSFTHHQFLNAPEEDKKDD